MYLCFLLSGLIEIHRVLKEGENDKWFYLDDCKHGMIHLRFTWLGLSPSLKDLEMVPIYLLFFCIWDYTNKNF